MKSSSAFCELDGIDEHGKPGRVKLENNWYEMRLSPADFAFWQSLLHSGDVNNARRTNKTRQCKQEPVITIWVQYDSPAVKINACVAAMSCQQSQPQHCNVACCAWGCNPENGIKDTVGIMLAHICHRLQCTLCAGSSETHIIDDCDQSGFAELEENSIRNILSQSRLIIVAQVSLLVAEIRSSAASTRVPSAHQSAAGAPEVCLGAVDVDIMVGAVEFSGENHCYLRLQAICR